MHIFIDESGPFVTPTEKDWAASCVGALVVKDSDVVSIFETFRKLKATWGIGEEEIKGSRLNESQINDVIAVLANFDLIFEVVAIDMALQTKEGITAARQAQAEVFIQCIDERFAKGLVADLHSIRNSLLGTSNQLYLQGVCTWYLLNSVLNKACLYFVQRMPEELGAFHWRFDSKGDKITPFEQLWTTISMPILESMSIQEPFRQLEGGDYSHFSIFEKELPVPPDRLKAVIKDSGPFRYLDTKAIFERDRLFVNSNSSLGIQLVDILTTATRRAMNGNLQAPGWASLGSLMVQAGRDKQVIQMLDISCAPKASYPSQKPPYFKVIRLTDQTCKTMRPMGG